jgi:UDP-GlcNAc:undecaprenyl-phosphate/decaprenyl-phosphate GlcNAc-1-phosphate transferase
VSSLTGLGGDSASALWLGFALAVVFAALAAVAVRATSRRAGLVDAPDPLVPAHTKPVATLGGIAVAFGLLIGALVVNLDPVGLEFAVGGALFLVIGVVDDVLKLSVSAKLLLQVVGAATVVALGTTVDLTGRPLLDALIAFAWILVLVNAVNLTDICDGLVSGLAAIAFLTLAAIDPTRGEAAVLAAGACLGFLVLNAPRASIFLGDAGSHFVGFLLAALSLQTVNGRDALAEFSAVVLTVGVFLFELAFLISARRRRGLRWWLGSDDHVALRLQAAGLSVWSTNVVLWVCGAMLGIAAILIHRLDGIELLPLGLAIAAFLVVAWRFLSGLAPPTEAGVAAHAGMRPSGR